VLSERLKASKNSGSVFIPGEKRGSSSLPSQTNIEPKNNEKDLTFYKKLECCVMGKFQSKLGNRTLTAS
jgi:hypothetical protein